MSVSVPKQGFIQWLIVAVALLLAAWMLAKLVVRLGAESPQMNLQLQSVRPVNQIVRFNWFSDNGISTAPVERVDEDLPEARINASLLGVVMTDNLALASLSIGGRDKLFTRGDTITNGVILEQIEPLRVVVSEAGVLRQINLKNLGKGGAEADQELVRIQGRQESAGFELSGVLGASPMSLEDGSLGFRLSNISPEIAGMADLQERDIVVNVNGVPVEDLLVNPSRWQQIIGQSNVPLILVRDGQQQEIYVNAESLAERIMPQLGAGMVQSE